MSKPGRKPKRVGTVYLIEHHGPNRHERRWQRMLYQRWQRRKAAARARKESA